MSRDSPAGNADEHAMVVDDEPEVPSEEEEHTALLAKAYFDLNEFQRAAHALRGARHPRSRFLRWYALFLAGEKHKDEEAVEDSTRDSLSVPSGKPRVVNKQLAQLQSELQPASDEGVLDGFGHYVHALVLRELQRKAEAVSALVRAVAIYPLLWAAWTEIAALVTEPLFTSRADRERLAQMMFESFNVAGLYVAERPVAALYAVGKVSGVSVDVGYAVTDVAPVVEGAVVAPAAQRRFVGSKHLSRAVADACFAAADASPEPRWNAARDAVLAVASSRDEFDADPAATPATSYALPDGNVVEVSGATRAGIPEALLRGADVGASAPAAAALAPLRAAAGESSESASSSSSGGVSDAVLAAVQACTPEQRRACLDAVATSGGWAGGAGRRAGFGERVARDLEDALPPSAKPMVAHAPEHVPASAAGNAAWVGGAILAKAVFPQNQHVSRIEYQENGPAAVTRGRG